MGNNGIGDNELGLQSDLVLVINQAGHIENLFNQIISDYCAPREHARYFMWSVVLDTSVMPLGSKLKVVMAVANALKFKLPKDALSKVVQLRNSFAHNTTDAHPVISVGVRPEDTKMYNLFWTLDGNGVLKETKRHEAFDAFTLNYQKARVALVELRDLVLEERENHTKWATVRKPKAVKDA